MGRHRFPMVRTAQEGADRKVQGFGEQGHLIQGVRVTLSWAEQDEAGKTQRAYWKSLKPVPWGKQRQPGSRPGPDFLPMPQTESTWGMKTEVGGAANRPR